MNTVEIILSIIIIGQFFYYSSKFSDIENTQSQDRVNFNHEIGYIKKRIESLDEKIDTFRIAIGENLNKIKDKLSKEIEGIKSDFSSFKDRREVYSELLDKSNELNKNFLYQVKDINSKVDDYTKSIGLINHKQDILESKFKDINKHLELFKTNLLIDNYNKGKKNEKS